MRQFNRSIPTNGAINCEDVISKTKSHQLELDLQSLFGKVSSIEQATIKESIKAASYATHAHEDAIAAQTAVSSAHRLLESIAKQVAEASLSAYTALAVAKEVKKVLVDLAKLSKLNLLFKGTFVDIAARDLKLHSPKDNWVVSIGDHAKGYQAYYYESDHWEKMGVSQAASHFDDEAIKLIITQETTRATRAELANYVASNKNTTTNAAQEESITNLLIKVASLAILGRFRGTFVDIASRDAGILHPKLGDYVMVGEKSPYVEYIYGEGTWEQGGKSKGVAVGVFASIEEVKVGTSKDTLISPFTLSLMRLPKEILDLLNKRGGSDSDFVNIGLRYKGQVNLGEGAIGDQYYGYEAVGHQTYGSKAIGRQTYGSKATAQQTYGNDSTGGISFGSSVGNQDNNNLVAGNKSATIKSIIDSSVVEIASVSDIESGTAGKTVDAVGLHAVLMSLKKIMSLPREILDTLNMREVSNRDIAKIGRMYKAEQY
jgi:hypothetical protein